MTRSTTRIVLARLLDRLALVVLAGLLLLAASTSARAATANFDDLGLSPNTHWNGPTATGVDLPDPFGGPLPVRVGTFNTGGIEFVNRYNHNYGSWSGFAYSNRNDTTTAGFGNQFSAITGSGFGSGADNYGIGFGFDDVLDPNNVAQLSELPYFELPAGATIQGARITNMTFAYLSMLNGDGFSKKFGGTLGSDPDWFKLSIYGTDESLLPLGAVVEFYLADFRFANHADDYIVNTWAFVDLSSLAGASRLYFNLSSSDVGTFGMNTPGTFAIDNVLFTPVPEPSSIVMAGFGAALLGLTWWRKKRFLV